MEKQTKIQGETYDAVLVRILEYVSQDDELDPETIKNIEKSTADIKSRSPLYRQAAKQRTRTVMGSSFHFLI